MDGQALEAAFRDLGERYPLFPRDAANRELWANSFATTDSDAFTHAVATWIERHGQWPTPSEIHELVRRQSLGLANARAALAKGYADEVRKLGREPQASWTQREDSPDVTHPAG